MKYIKKYEEIKYTEQHKKLIQKARYALNKYFGGNYCGVTKVRWVNNPKYGQFGEDYTMPYTGDVMLFSIYLPNFLRSDIIIDYELKINGFREMAKELNYGQEYTYTNTPNDFILNEEQLKNLPDKVRELAIFVYTNKYNL